MAPVASSVTACCSPCKRADRRAGIGLGNHAADIVERNVARGRRDRIDLDTHREFLRAEHQHLGDAGQLRNLRRQHGFGIVVHRRQRHGVGAHADIEHREVARVDLAEERRRGHFDRQPALRHRQRGLHVERGAVDVAAEIELDGDLRDAERRRRSSSTRCRRWSTAAARSARQPRPPWFPGWRPASVAVIWMVGKSTAGSAATGSSR